MTNVVDLRPAENPDNILKEAMGVYTQCLILGWDKEDYFNPRASLGLTTEELLMLVEVFKFRLLNGDYA